MKQLQELGLCLVLRLPGKQDSVGLALSCLPLIREDGHQTKELHKEFPCSHVILVFLPTQTLQWLSSMLGIKSKLPPCCTRSCEPLTPRSDSSSLTHVSYTGLLSAPEHAPSIPTFTLALLLSLEGSAFKSLHGWLLPDLQLCHVTTPCPHDTLAEVASVHCCVSFSPLTEMVSLVYFLFVACLPCQNTNSTTAGLCLLIHHHVQGLRPRGTNGCSSNSSGVNK